jgi:hypothetical protein
MAQPFVPASFQDIGEADQIGVDIGVRILKASIARPPARPDG